MIPGPARPGLIHAGSFWSRAWLARRSFHPGGEEAVVYSAREHTVVSLCRRQLRTLRRIERDLADSDPGLDALYQGFARRSSGLDLRWLEKADRRRFRIFSRRHERSLGERIKD